MSSVYQITGLVGTGKKPGRPRAWSPVPPPPGSGSWGAAIYHVPDTFSGHVPEGRIQPTSQWTLNDSRECISVQPYMVQSILLWRYLCSTKTRGATRARHPEGIL